MVAGLFCQFFSVRVRVRVGIRVRGLGLGLGPEESSPLSRSFTFFSFIKVTTPCLKGQTCFGFRLCKLLSALFTFILL
ncbi:unnamed protein product [Rhizophagus irregularis]|nr:unnamed protein product [Rhizophagus irregularis]